MNKRAAETRQRIDVTYVPDDIFPYCITISEDSGLTKTIWLNEGDFTYLRACLLAMPVNLQHCSVVSVIPLERG
jgi:hypothetical protein